MSVLNWHIRNWLAFGFDREAKPVYTAVHFDTFPDAARQMFATSVVPRDGFPLACAVLCSPEVGPHDLRASVDQIAANPLPYKVGRLLLPHTRRLWDWREPGAGG